MSFGFIGMRMIKNMFLYFCLLIFSINGLANSIDKESAISEFEVVNEAPQEIVSALIEKLSVDWNSGDMSAYLHAYADVPHFRLAFGDRVIKTKTEMRSFFEKSWATKTDMGVFFTEKINVASISSQLVLATGNFQHQFESETIVGAFSQLWMRRSDGAWQIIQEHTSRQH